LPDTHPKTYKGKPITSEIIKMIASHHYEGNDLDDFYGLVDGISSIKRSIIH